MTSDKAIAHWTIDALVQLGMRRLIFSPGSRNTPLIIAGTGHPSIEYNTVLDERSAAFQAIGASLMTDQIVGVCCTSGSALANYHPAVLEAFYSKIPLVLITADRPASRIGKGEGQTCHQTDFYGAHVGFSASFDESTTPDEFKEVFEHLHHSLTVLKEPVHINIHFDEPLYGQREHVDAIELQELNHPKARPVDLSLFDACQKVAIVCGQLRPEEAKLVKSSGIISSSNATWFVDPLSGLLGEDNCVNIDELVHCEFDGLLSFGGQWMSKFPKFHVRNLNLKVHVHIDPYQAWNVSDSESFIWRRVSLEGLTDWSSCNFLKIEAKPIIIPDLPWSDALAIQTIVQSLSADDVLHLGNSSIPRYMSYFLHQGSMYCNRGISGIDGSLSTAIGAARMSPEKNHVLLIGDQSFLYDSNGLMHLGEVDNLRVFVINNCVGEIFNWLPGTAQTSAAAQAVYSNYQEVDIATLALAYDCRSEVVQNLSELQNAKSKVVEVLTVEGKNTESFAMLKKLN
jgi:2-succinyl-5-enolpyruvyl-6-hydroxy-3-cyclohexene-1-carboxylate synthase